MPYTYLIGWSTENKYYYGVRFAKGCDPKELWVSYKTSSKYVLDSYKKLGDPDVVQIRKIFDDSDKARLWENKVLKRMKVTERTDFLNKTDNISIKSSKDYDRAKNFSKYLDRIRGKTWEEIHSQETIDKLKAGAKRAGLKKRGKTIKKCSDTTNYSKAAVKRWEDDERLKAVKSRRHMNKNGSKRFALPEEQKILLEDGWIYGRG